jgi:hypothetical protein
VIDAPESDPIVRDWQAWPVVVLLASLCALVIVILR